MVWITYQVEGERFKVIIGNRMVIQGMEQGMIGQCVVSPCSSSLRHI
jgi:hypothetical protein